MAGIEDIKRARLGQRADPASPQQLKQMLELGVHPSQLDTAPASQPPPAPVAAPPRPDPRIPVPGMVPPDLQELQLRQGLKAQGRSVAEIELIIRQMKGSRGGAPGR